MADVRKIFQKCVGDRRKSTVVRGKDVMIYFKSPFSLWCNHHADEALKDPLTDYQKILFDRGNKHEEEFVKETYPDLVEIEFEDEVHGFRELLKQLDNGTRAIHGLPLFYYPENLQGRFDIIERVPKANTVFGPYHYVVKEIKVAKNIKEYHIMQAAFYHYMLSKIQGYVPEHFYLINQEGEEFAYKFAEYEKKLLDALEEIKDIITGKEISACYGEAMWPWESYSKKKAIEDNDVSLIPGVGFSVRKKLNKAGFLKVPDVANASLSDLIKIPSIGPVKGRQLLLSADAINSNEAIVFDKKILDFPERKCEIFLDLEGTDDSLEEPFLQVEYLIGCLIREGKKFEYIPFIAHKFADEEKMFKQFLEFLKKKRSFAIYHWGSYEKSAMKKLLEKYGGDVTEAFEKKIFNNMTDVLEIIKKSVAFPTYSNSLKDIAPWLGFKWRHKEVTAMESIAYYLEYASDPKVNEEKIQLVLDYNEDDVRATALVKDWLADKVS